MDLNPIDSKEKERTMTSQTRPQANQTNDKEVKQTTSNDKATITIREAVKIALITSLHCRTLVRKGVIEGSKDETGKWQVKRQSVVKYAKERQEAYEDRIQRIRNGENVQNIRPTTATANRMRKAIENDKALTPKEQELFITAVDRYEQEWDRKYEERKAKTA